MKQLYLSISVRRPVCVCQQVNTAAITDLIELQSRNSETCEVQLLRHQAAKQCVSLREQINAKHSTYVWKVNNSSQCKSAFLPNGGWTAMPLHPGLDLGAAVTLGRPSPCCPVEIRCWYLSSLAFALSSSACAAFRCLPLDDDSSCSHSNVSGFRLLSDP